jgi:hypothetical protein
MATKKTSKKAMSKKSMKKTKGGLNFTAPIARPTESLAPNTAQKVREAALNPGAAQGCATGEHYST